MYVLVVSHFPFSSNIFISQFLYDMQNKYTYNNTLHDWNGSLVLTEFLSEWKIRYRLHNRGRSETKVRDYKLSVNMLKYIKEEAIYSQL